MNRTLQRFLGAFGHLVEKAVAAKFKVKPGTSYKPAGIVLDYDPPNGPLRGYVELRCEADPGLLLRAEIDLSPLHTSLSCPREASVERLREWIKDHLSAKDQAMFDRNTTWWLQWEVEDKRPDTCCWEEPEWEEVGKLPPVSGSDWWRHIALQLADMHVVAAREAFARKTVPKVLQERLESNVGTARSLLSVPDGKSYWAIKTVNQMDDALADVKARCDKTLEGRK
jgi:hypothetical protein